MEKYIIISFIFILYNSCRENKHNMVIRSDFFIENPGLYYLKNSKLRLAEFNNGSLAYSVMKNDNDSIVIPANIFMPFSKYQVWCIYIDKYENIWHYNSDLQINEVWIKNDSGNYSYHNYITEKITPPKKFTNYIK